MKRFKFLMSAIMIFACLIFIGEVYVWHLDNFESNYTYTTMYMQKEATQPQMISDLDAAAQRYDVDFFVIDRHINSLFSETINIYATPNAISSLRQDADVFSGTFHSIFLGKVTLNIVPFDQVPNLLNTTTYYMIGDKENIISFKKSLVNSYAGKIPQSSSTQLQSDYLVTATWGIMYTLLLLMTLYEITLSKKETMIRAILGQSIRSNVLKNILQNILFYLTCFIFSILFLRYFTNCTYNLPTTIFFTCIFLFLNSLLYLLLYNSDYKKDIVTNVGAKNVLTASYIVKTITTIVFIVVMAGNISIILKSIDFYQQRSFFRDHSEDYYITLSSRENNQSTEDIRRLLYQTASEQGKVITLTNLTSWNTDAEYILADGGSLSYLKAQLPELEKLTLHKKVYFLIPDDRTEQAISQDMFEILESYYQGTYDYEVIPYKSGERIFSIQNMGQIKSKHINNPIIILNLLDPTSVSSYWNVGYIANAAIFHYTEQEYSNFIKNVGYENENCYLTNVYENYMYQWEIVKRNLYTCIVLFCIMLFLEATLIKTVLKFEYSVHATELSLKKIFGHTLFNRYKKMFITTGVSWILGSIVSIVLNALLNISSISSFILAGTVLLILEIWFVMLCINSIEHRNIQRILKGERI